MPALDVSSNTNRKAMKHVFLTLLNVATLAVQASGATTTYSLFDQGPFGGFTLSGTITTDSTQGVLSEANVLSWSITASDGTDTLIFSSELANHAVRMHSTPLNATSTNLFLPEGSVLIFQLDRPTRDLNLQWERRILGGNQTNRFSMYDNDISRGYFHTEPFFTTASHAIAGVPEPSSLLLTGSACVWLCLAGRRRKMS